MQVKSYSFKSNTMLFVHANGLFLTAVENLFCWELKPLAKAVAGIVAMGHAGVARKAAMCDLIYLKQKKKKKSLLNEIVTQQVFRN